MLHNRHVLVELYKTVTGLYNKNVSLNLEYVTSNLRGNKYKLYQGQLHYNLRKFSFSNRVIKLWNDLPDAVVGAENLNGFKNALDKFWFHQEVKFNPRFTRLFLATRTTKGGVVVTPPLRSFRYCSKTPRDIVECF